MSALVVRAGRGEALRRVGRAVVLCASVFAAGISAQPVAAAPPVAEVAGSVVPSKAWGVRLPTIDKVVFRGSVSHDAAGLGTGTFLYPAPGPAGLLVAVLTHGLITDRMRQIQKNQLQNDADQVLQRFKPVLEGFTNRQLIEAGLGKTRVGGKKRLLEATEAAGDAWLIESAPVFSMTQDQRALVLDNAVRIIAPGSTTIAYAQTVRVVSAPLPLPPPLISTTPDDSVIVDTAAPWIESQGRRLRDESALLLAESLDAALDDFAEGAVESKSPQRTFRYAEGGSEKMERAQLVAARCGRSLIRTLRGWLMSIPAGDREPCVQVGTAP